MIVYSPVHSPVWIKHLRSSPFKHAFFLIGCPLPSESGWGLCGLGVSTVAGKYSYYWYFLPEHFELSEALELTEIRALL